MIEVEKLKREAGAFICGEYTSDRIDYCPDCRTVDKIIDYIARRNLLDGVPDGFVLVPKNFLDVLHQKPVYTNYDRQCGYLDCLSDAKALLAAAPSSEKVGG